MQQRWLVRVLCGALIVVVLGGLMTGCSGSRGAGGDDAARSEELTPGEFPERKPTSPTPPPPPQLKRPETAVYSYLVWISYAYRVLDSDVASHTFSPYEEVRVNSYVQLNKQEARALDQRLVDFRIRGTQTKGETATVGVIETWKYRYIDLKSGEYGSPIYDVSYDTTYTVVRQAPDRWVVDRVEAAPKTGEVK